MNAQVERLVRVRKFGEVWQVIKLGRSDFPAVLGLVMHGTLVSVKQYTLVIRKESGDYKRVTYLYWARQWIEE